MKYLFYILLFSFILFSSCQKESSPVTPQSDHADAVGLAIYDSDQLLLTYFNGVSTDTLFVQDGKRTNNLLIKFLDPAKKVLNDSLGADKKLSWLIEDSSVVTANMLENDKWKFYLNGKKAGKTRIKFQLLHIDHPDFQSDFLNIIVK